MAYRIADLSDEKYKSNKEYATYLYIVMGENPTYSTSICGSLTAGYGRCDVYGYWEFPLPVNQETKEIDL